MKLQKGFTLIELLITVAIVGILASIVVPSYQDYVTRGKVAEGTATLADARVKMEQYFQDNRTYAGADAAVGPCPANTPNFSYACSNLDATNYTITATGLRDIADFSYSIDQANTKSSNTRWGNGATCWIMIKNGTC
ncbi:MAG: pilus assembly protein PilE [Sideroxydans sp.]|nr:pilus assembly protein PilE [Sideroxydans sp.]